MIAIIAFFLSPIGRYLLIALAIVGAAFWAIKHFESVGAEKERARIEKVNRNAEDKASAARAASERSSDDGGVQLDDGWRRD